MRRVHQLRAFFANLFRRSKVDADLSEELDSYVELLAEQTQQTGVDADTARRAAKLQLGGVAQVTDSIRQQRAGAGIERFWQDVHYALRGLRRAPGFAAMAILTLGLGLGANTAIFSVVDAALFKPLPYKDPDALVNLASVTGRGTADERFAIGVSWKTVDRWRNEPQIFSAIEPFAYSQPMKTDDVGATPTLVGKVAPGLLTMLDVRPIVGRWLTADDITQSRDVVLLSEAYWRRAFLRDPTVVGRELSLDGRRYTIVGVMPAKFGYRVGGVDTIGWLVFDEVAERQLPGAWSSPTIFRLRPGLTRDHANQELRLAAERLQPGVAAASRWDVEALPLDGRKYGYDDRRAPLLLLLGAVACVLLIACANVANLMLSRIFARQREIAVRAALGATRSRLVRQFLTEGMVLAVFGGVAALAFAWWTVQIIPATLPPRLWLFGYNPMALDWRTAGFCGGAVLLTGLLCALVPAVRASRANLSAAFESSTRIAGGTTRARRLRHTLQSIQVALTLVLLAGAGLMASSFVKILGTEPGFDIDRLATVFLQLPASRYATPAVQQEFFDVLLSRVRGLPGIAGAAYGTSPAESFAGTLTPFGREQDLNLPASALTVHYVGRDYFSVAGIPILAGRPIQSDDEAGESVAVIDENAARMYWPDQSAIGQRFRTSPRSGWRTVIGVVGHVKTTSFTTGATTQAYVPVAQLSGPASRALLIRANGEALGAAGTVVPLVRTLDSTLAPPAPMPVNRAFDAVVATPRFYLVLMSLLAGLALLTASIGLYGVVSYSVSQRTREIGVRLALGADRTRIHGLVLREAMTPVLAGIAAGLIAAFWATTYLGSQLYQVSPHDPVTLGVVVVTLTVVGAAAAMVPARRATRVDPVIVLRVE